MNLSIYEMIQITIEAFAVILCVVSSLILIANGLNHISRRLLWLFLTNVIILVMDCVATYFSGNNDLFSIGATRTTYFIMYSLNVFMMLLSCRLLFRFLHSAQIEPGKVFWYVVLLSGILAEVILVISQLTGFMYRFNDDNQIARNFGWYVFVGVMGVGLFFEIGLVLCYRKALASSMAISLIVYTLIPGLTTLAQIFVSELSFTSVGVAVGLIFILFAYLKNWITIKNERGEAGLHERTLLATGIIFFVTVVCMTSSIVNCVLSIQKISDENNLQEDMLLTQTVEDHVTKELLKPITVSQTMSKDTFLVDLFHQGPTGEAIINVADYLDSLRNQFGYKMVFVASDISGNFYTYEGVTRQIGEADDKWYYDFVDSNKDYELNVDTDEISKGEFAIFVNTRITADSKLAGVCGVGVSLGAIQDVIYKYEMKYNVEIYFTNAAGVIQIANDDSLINEKRVDTTHFQAARMDDGYVHFDEGIDIVKYMPELDWYIVVQDDNPNRLNTKSIIFPSILIFSVGLLIMIVVFWLIFQSERKTRQELCANRIFSSTDELTGLYNRHAYEADRKLILEGNRLPEIVVVMMDVNGLKRVNDNIGHDAGDRLLIGAATCMQDAFCRYGRIYRTGGDEFVALLYCNRNQVEECIVEFDTRVSRWKVIDGVELSVSKGVAVATEHPDLDMKELEKLADHYMYEDKDAFYHRTEKERRGKW